MSDGQSVQVVHFSSAFYTSYPFLTKEPMNELVSSHSAYSISINVDLIIRAHFTRTASPSVGGAMGSEKRLRRSPRSSLLLVAVHRAVADSAKTGPSSPET